MISSDTDFPHYHLNKDRSQFYPICSGGKIAIDCGVRSLIEPLRK